MKNYKFKKLLQKLSIVVKNLLNDWGLHPQTISCLWWLATLDPRLFRSTVTYFHSDLLIDFLN